MRSEHAIGRVGLVARNARSRSVSAEDKSCPLDASPGEAISAYLHELGHHAGRDGDARFSDELTTTLANAVEYASRLEEIRQLWYVAPEMKGESLGEMLELLRTEKNPWKRLAQLLS